MTILRDIQDHIKQTDILEKLIYINVALYIVTLFATDFMPTWFALPTSLAAFANKPWTLISYAFIHKEFFHILSNLIVLYYIGNLFLNFFSKKKLLIYYILGGMAGGISFLLFYFVQNKTGYPLGGASAAVSAILVGLTVKVPHYSLRLRFIGSVELWVLTAIWIGLSVITTAGVNPGGGVAHLGGAIIGYLLTAYFREGAIFENLFSNSFKNKKTPFKDVYTNPKAPKTKQGYSTKKQNQRKIDAILDKISKSGYEALTKEEKEFLFNQKD